MAQGQRVGDFNEVQKRRGRPPLNRPTAATVVEKTDWATTLTKDDILTFGNGPSQWTEVVHKIAERGIYCRPSLHDEPDLSHCRFYSWAELDSNVTERS